MFLVDVFAWKLFGLKDKLISSFKLVMECSEVASGNYV